MFGNGGAGTPSAIPPNEAPPPVPVATPGNFLLVPATVRGIFRIVRVRKVVKNNFYIVSALPPQLSEPPLAREMTTHTTGNGNIARPNQSSTPTMVCYIIK